MRDCDGKYYNPYVDQDSFEQNECDEENSSKDYQQKRSDAQSEYWASKGIYGDDIWED